LPEQTSVEDEVVRGLRLEPDAFEALDFFAGDALAIFDDDARAGVLRDGEKVGFSIDEGTEDALTPDMLPEPRFCRR